jgi:ferredoxin
LAHTIRLKGPDKDFVCASDEAVLSAIRRQHIAGVEVGCRGGGCGICRIRVLSGRFRTGRMSRCQVTVEEEAGGIVLACRVYPEEDLVIEALGLKSAGQDVKA